MKNIIFIIFAGLFLVSCSMQDEVANPQVEEVVIEFDSFAINFDTCMFSRDSVAISIASGSVGEYYILSQDSTLTPVNIADVILCKRGDRILLDVNFDGEPEQVETVNFPWFHIEATFHPQYGEGVAFARVYCYSTIINPVSGSHIPWGNFSITTNDGTFPLNHISPAGVWCSGICVPYAMGYIEVGQTIWVDYGGDGIKEQEEVVVDPNHV